MKSNYKLKCKHEDFIVNEVPLLPCLSPQKSSRYTYFWLKKKGLTTFDAQEIIAKFFEVNQLDINVEGLKDEDAITFQIFSIKKILRKRIINGFNQKLQPGLKIESIIGYGKEPVNEKFLHGNTFVITIRNLDKSIAHEFHNLVLSTRLFPFINYYDNQRFGLAGGPYNTHLIGKSIVKNDWERAFFEFQKSGNNIRKNEPLIKKGTSRKNYKNFFKTISPKKVAFFVSSYNSYLWNNEASRLVEKFNKGELEHFNGVGDLFIPRSLSFYSTSTCQVKGHHFDKNNFKIEPKTDIRSLVVNTNIYSTNLNEDELNKSKWKVEISFFLPTGCYATMLIKQIFLRYFKKV